MHPAQRRREHAAHHAVWLGGVRERPQDVEDGPRALLAMLGAGRQPPLLPNAARCTSGRVAAKALAGGREARASGQRKGNRDAM